MTWFLDTSALLAHFLDEPGAERVEALLGEGPEWVVLAAPVWVELDRRLQELIPERAEAEEIWRHYTQHLCSLAVLDQLAIEASIKMQHACERRLPLVDALIAGCASAHGSSLLHRDHHLDAVPRELLVTERLPDRP